MAQSPRFAQVASYWLSPNLSIERRRHGTFHRTGGLTLLYKLRLLVFLGFSLGLDRVSLRLRG